MATRVKHLAVAGVLAVAGLGFLLKTADFGRVDITNLSIGYAFTSFVAMLVMVSARGKLLRGISPSMLEIVPIRWQKLVAQHQLLFMLAPSGTGDVSFLILAKHHLGLDAARATATLALYRARDLTVLLALGLAGGSMVIGMPVLAGLIIMAACVVLWLTEDFAKLAVKLTESLLPDGRAREFLARCAASTSRPSGGRLARLLAVVVIWTASSVGVYGAFATAGRYLTIEETLLMLAALNASGALAISIGGLGVAETGAMFMLMLFGDDAGQAAATTLVARPLLFLSAVAASAALGLISSSVLYYRQAARR